MNAADYSDEVIGVERPSHVYRTWNEAAESALPEVSELEAQRIWLATQTRTWRTLALVPAGPAMATLQLAALLRGIGRLQSHGSYRVADLRSVTIEEARANIEMIQSVGAGERVVLPLAFPRESPAAVLLARAADAAILCVAMGQTRLAHAAEAVEAIGRERFLGAVLLSSMPPVDATGSRAAP